MRKVYEELVDPDIGLDRLIDALPDALIIAGEDGKIVVFNTQAELMFGYTRSEIIGSPVDILVPEASRKQHANHVEGYMKEPRVRPMGVGMVLAGISKNGKEFPVKINLSPIVTKNGVYVLAAIRKA